ncbi:MAG: serine/threonine-protein kinase [Phycisphaerae bacterium]|nr:serine/threonine-protein kinase [Phycisphaerae bacterium]
MSGSLDRRAHTLLREALDQPDDTRRAFVDAACGCDSDQRSAVHRLLDADEANEGFLESPGWCANNPGAGPRSVVGRTIDDFTIIALAGTGGMGEVYRAEQRAPRRPVALKIIRGETRPSPVALARFALEAEALGRLQHPNVAQVIASGMFDRDGDPMPYVAMEWIEQARPLVAFAAAEQLSESARLELFLLIAGAVSHAHVRGVIHRDLKSANVLVSASGQPKIIDFGLALLTGIGDGGDPERATLGLTLGGQFIGTLASMSPEQCRGGQRSVDMRCDVYALGALLYELLEGRAAFDLSKCSLAEAVNVICDAEPAQPRTASTDLAAVIMTALAKAPEDRYASVDALIRDIRNTIEHRPIEARTPTIRRRARLFIRRHRGAAIAAGLVAGAMVVAGTSLSIGLMKAQRAEAEATQRLIELGTVTEFLRSLFDADDDGPLDATRTIAAQLKSWESRVEDGLRDTPEIRATMHLELGRAFEALDARKDARRHLELALADALATLGPEAKTTIVARGRLARLLRNEGFPRESAAEFEAILPVAARVMTDDQDSLDVIRSDCAMTRHELGQFEEAAQLLDGVLANRRAKSSPEPTRVAATLGQLGRVRAAQQRLDEAEHLYREAIELERQAFAPDSLRTIATKNNLAVLLRQRGQLDEAERLAREVYETRRARQTADHPETLTTQSNWAMMLVSRRKFEEAREVLTDSLERHRRVLGAHHRGTAITGMNLSRVLLDCERWSEAAEQAEPAKASLAHAFGETNWRLGYADAIRGRALMEMGERDAGVELLNRAITAMQVAAAQPAGAVKASIEAATAWRDAPPR